MITNLLQVGEVLDHGCSDFRRLCVCEESVDEREEVCVELGLWNLS